MDACAIRNKSRDELLELCEKTGFPVYASPMGKTAIGEQYERYGGVSCCVFIFEGLTSKFHHRSILATSQALRSKKRSRTPS